MLIYSGLSTKKLVCRIIVPKKARQAYQFNFIGRPWSGQMQMECCLFFFPPFFSFVHVSSIIITIKTEIFQVGNSWSLAYLTNTKGKSGHKVFCFLQFYFSSMLRKLELYIIYHRSINILINSKCQNLIFVKCYLECPEVEQNKISRPFWLTDTCLYFFIW